MYAILKYFKDEFRITYEGNHDTSIFSPNMYVFFQIYLHSPISATDSDRLVFGEDIDMDRVVEFSELAVVGRARGKRLGSPYLRSWMETSWGSNLSVLPSIRLLARGWFAFVFSATTDVSWVLSKTWSMDGTPIVMKWWTPSFDAKRERVDVVHVWVHLPGLPMQYWNPVRFSAIGNKLGEYLDADFSFEETCIMSMARILVRLDLRSRLLKELTIETTSGSFIQPLDYEGIPFICHRCHAYGHGIADCKFPFKSKARGPGDGGIDLGSGCADRGTGGSGGAHTVASQPRDRDRDLRRTLLLRQVFLRMSGRWRKQRFRSPQTWLALGR
jgi:hypothetical protein